MSGETIEIRHAPGGRARFLGRLIHAIKNRALVRILTNCTELAELPLELKVLLEARAPKAVGGAGASLGWLGGRALLSRLALSRLLLGGALLGASVASGMLGAFLMSYRFRIAEERGRGGELILEGAPRGDPG